MSAHEPNGRVKLSPGDALKLAVLIFGVGAAWTTLAVGQASTAARVERVERKIDRLDSLLVLSQFKEVTRFEFEHAQNDDQQTLNDLDKRLREVEIEVTKPQFYHHGGP